MMARGGAAGSCLRGSPNGNLPGCSRPMNQIATCSSRQRPSRIEPDLE